MIAALWSRFAGYIAALGAVLAIIVGAFLKGKAAQKAETQVEELRDANQIRKDGAAARAGADTGKLSNDGWRRD